MGSHGVIGAGIDEPGLPLTLQVCLYPREEEEVEEKVEVEEKAAARGLHGASSKAPIVQ